ncbi:TRAP transporter fused permease subunit [Aquisalimonas lutea]|uniref:TRAP transporter permease n=1 Tax=Aquisalimonas lutea TaxID=1327750 RepID=UPI0025B51D45|nr:TRAP transporter fused permease subunit [Aquisalimonas lutea]MDN3516529.1 TRAP transporter fused permease subunit [Aquisalimonas lutea]
MTDQAHDTEARQEDERLLVRWRDFIRPVPLIALAWVAFQVALFVWPEIDLMVRRSGHIAFATALALCIVARDASDGARIKGWCYWGLAGLALLPPLYLLSQLERIYYRIVELDPVLIGDFAVAILAIGLLLEAVRRRAGIGMFILAAFFIVYQLLGPYLPGVLGHRIAGFDTFVEIMLLTERGILGIPTAVSANIVFYFILFAAVFDVFGGGRLIIELAMRLTGRQIGGPAKASVVASAMTGSVSGSAVANVMSTGIFTIPLMRRVGYTPTFAAATEAVASTGGQILPPVMGAGAFVMAHFLQVPYRDVVFAALLPALAFFVSLLLVVHYRARLDNVATLKLEEVGDWRAMLRERWHLLIPLVWLAVIIVSGLGVAEAAVQATALTIILGTARRTTRQRPLQVVTALVRTGERALSVALPCAAASLIVSVISMTGLGTKFTGMVVTLSEGNLSIAMILAGLASLVLGAGMPTTSAYIMAATLVAPALVTLSVEPMVAHLFVFYMSIISMVTPPVALAAYAASTVADTSPSATGWRALYLAIPGLIIPFAFVLHPALVVWGSLPDVAWAVIQVVVACWAFTVMVSGWLNRPLGGLERGLFAAGGVASIIPVFVVSLAGFSLLVALAVATLITAAKYQGHGA